MPAARKETSNAAVRPEWRDARRIVVKIGSALLVDHATGRLRSAWLNSIADDVKALTAEGREVILVSSGAIALGRHVLKLPKGVLALEHSQAAASVGQISLSSAYQDAFNARGLIAAQILLTIGDTEERRRYLNARSTMATLLARHAVPVVNENDTVATAEIRYGDNDRLSARVASMMSADCLVLLSDVDGLYTAPPAKDPNAKRLDVVQELTHEILAMAGDAGTELSKGGMVTKLEAARIAMGSGTNMVITHGAALNPLRRLADGAPCTWFLASSDPVAARKRWIAGNLEPRGSVFVDAGAEKALGQGKSLLPAGVVRIEGTFDRGDAVSIRALDGRQLGRGLIAYPHDEAAAIIGKRSSAIAAILGHEGRAELIHRDDMALTRTERA
ncbi:MAG TPA: glutamate 5-kinase [Hyphomicrobiaceae bacterium]|nr:glutamate 5-kinase [Hyphomicrobiaceae bacterium]